MFDEPSENPAERAVNPADRAREKFDEFRMHAEFVAVFEGPRKFDARILPTLDGQLAREIQRTVGRLKKARSADTPLLPEASVPDAAGLLNLPHSRELSTNDYHIHRRPGEAMIVRFLAGDQVETFLPAISSSL
jgi:hypothetical protein